MVARGKVHNVNNDSVVHKASLPPGYMRVGIDYTTEELTPLPVPLDNGEASIIKEAIGTTVLWPIELIILDNPV